MRPPCLVLWSQVRAPRLQPVLLAWRGGGEEGGGHTPGGFSGVVCGSRAQGLCPQGFPAAKCGSFPRIFLRSASDSRRRHGHPSFLPLSSNPSVQRLVSEHPCAPGLEGRGGAGAGGERAAGKPPLCPRPARPPPARQQLYSLFLMVFEELTEGKRPSLGSGSKEKYTNVHPAASATWVCLSFFQVRGTIKTKATQRGVSQGALARFWKLPVTQGLQVVPPRLPQEL